MADELNADLVALNHGSNDMLDAVGDAALEFGSHEDGLAEAAPGWVGSSQAALRELTAHWGARHTHHKRQVGGLGTHVADAMTQYAAHDDGSTQTLGSLPG